MHCEVFEGGGAEADRKSLRNSLRPLASEAKRTVARYAPTSDPDDVARFGGGEEELGRGSDFPSGTSTAAETGLGGWGGG